MKLSVTLCSIVHYLSFATCFQINETKKNTSFPVVVKALTPKKILIVDAEENSLVCVHFKVDASFQNCRIKQPQLTLYYTFTQKHFLITRGQMHLNKSLMCKPLDHKKRGDFCFEFDRNKIPDSSQISFKKMFIKKVVLDCSNTTYKLQNEELSLFQIVPKEHTMNRKRINACPKSPCYKWREKDYTCRPNIIFKTLPVSKNKTRQATETVLLLGVMLITGTIIMTISHIAK